MKTNRKGKEGKKKDYLTARGCAVGIYLGRYREFWKNLLRWKIRNYSTLVVDDYFWWEIPAQNPSEVCIAPSIWIRINIINSFQ